MDGYLAVGTSAAAVLILRCFLWPPLSPQTWRIPDAAHIGPGIWVLAGCNAITEAIKVGRLLFADRFALRHGAIYEELSTDVSLIFLGGLFAILVLGLISIDDGIKRLRASPAR